MTPYNPFDAPDKSISDSQSGISQFDELMHRAKPNNIQSSLIHSFAFDVIEANNTQIIEFLMADTVDSVE